MCVVDRHQARPLHKLVKLISALERERCQFVIGHRSCGNMGASIRSLSPCARDDRRGVAERSNVRRRPL